MLALVTHLRKRLITESEFSTQKEMEAHERFEQEKSKNRLLQKLRERQGLLDGVERIDLEKIRRDYGDRLRLLSFEEQQELTRAVVNRVYVYEDHRVEVLFKEV